MWLDGVSQNLDYCKCWDKIWESLKFVQCWQSSCEDQGHRSQPCQSRSRPTLVVHKAGNLIITTTCIIKHFHDFDIKCKTLKVKLPLVASQKRKSKILVCPPFLQSWCCQDIPTAYLKNLTNTKSKFAPIFRAFSYIGRKNRKANNCGPVKISITILKRGRK